MRWKRISHILTSVLLAVTATVTIYIFDQGRSWLNDTEQALRWARQISSQIAGMAMTAREDGEKDSITWALRHVSQGTEPRILKISRFEAQPEQRSETYKLDRDNRVFEYTKILTPEDGVGVKLQIDTAYSGFLGSRSRVQNDFTFGTCFYLFFFVFFYSSRRWFQVVAPKNDGSLKSKVQRWVSEAKGLLTQLGIHIREMVREAQNLAVAAGKSKAMIQGLRDKIHEELREAHGRQKDAEEVHEISAMMEEVISNLASEVQGADFDEAQVMSLIEELQKYNGKMKDFTQRTGSLSRDLEKMLEPWSVDVDMAYHAYDDVFRATEVMSTHIRQTTERILGQARMIQNLNSDLGPASDAERAALAIVAPTKTKKRVAKK